MGLIQASGRGPENPPGRPAHWGIGGTIFRKSFVINITYVHCVHNVVNNILLALIAIAVHSVVVVVQQKIVAQVYTRDATHRPTATLTPSRGAFVTFRGFWGFSRGFRSESGQK